MMRSFVCLVLLFFASPLLGFAQTQKEEDLIHLLIADLAEQYQIDGLLYLRASGNAHFVHNNTHILCDTAIWDRNNGIIDAKGNIRIKQGQTLLTGEIVHYIEKQNLAQIRGKIVELSDNKNNRLRTQSLDFNTKDSIGTFLSGGSMIDSAGNILESVLGSYFSKENLFFFERTVEMSTDTVLIKSDSIYYRTDDNVATFFGNIHAWHADGYLRALRGRYHRDDEKFHFVREVYVQSEHQEIWADTLNYNRTNSSGSLFGSVQVLDTTQSIVLLGDEGHFQNDPQKVWFTRNPVFITYAEDKDNVRDTLFLRGDTLSLVTLPKYQVGSGEVAAANSRLRYLKPPTPLLPDTTSILTTDSLLSPSRRATLSDSLQATLPPRDSLQTILPPVDSSTTPKDTTLIRFISAWNNVKAYRSNAQGICDSLVYNSLDSTARLYKSPVLWNENNQFSADSVQFFFQNNEIFRADLFSSAFIISQEEEQPWLYNQIKGNNMIGYFRDNDIYRFDVTGSAEALFCFREDSLVTSINKKESKDLIITLKERQVQRVSYLSNIKSTLYPLYDLSEKERLLSNFSWRDSLRPQDRFDITSRNILPSIADQPPTETQPTFMYTSRFFPDHPIPKEVTRKVKEKPDSATHILPERTDILNLLQLDDTLVTSHAIQRDSLQLAVLADTTQIVTPVEKIPTPVHVRDTVANQIIPLEKEHPEDAVEDIPTLSKKELRAQRKALKREQIALRKVLKREQAALRKEEKRQRKEERLLRKKIG